MSKNSPPTTTTNHSPRPTPTPNLINKKTYRLGQGAPLLHLVQAVVEGWGEIVVPERQIAELRVDGPIPALQEKRGI